MALWNINVEFVCASALTQNTSEMIVELMCINPTETVKVNTENLSQEGDGIFTFVETWFS